MQIKLTKIGYISKAFGFKGELKCNLSVVAISEDFPEFLWMHVEGKPVPFFVEEFELNGSNLILKFEDLNSEDDAKVLKNTSIYCENEIFEDFFEKEESLDDFIGFEVIDLVKGNIGVIESIIENSIQPTLVIRFNDKEILIPYTESIILNIDEEEEIIEIEAPDGLIDMYLE